MLSFTRDFRKILISFLFLSLLVSSSYAHGFTYKKIKKIELVIGNSKIEDEIKKLILIKEGDNFSLRKVRDSIKLIYKTGFYSDIEVRIKDLKKNDEIEVIFLLKENFIISDIKFEGIGSTEIKNIEKKLKSIQEGEFFSESKLKRACEEIKGKLRERGYFYSSVNYYIKDIKKSKIKIFFRINPGKRLILKKIIFEGQNILSEKTLKKIMKTREGGVYKPYILKEDIERLRNLFQKKKYYRCKIELKEEIINPKEGSVIIKIGMDLGEKIEFLVRGAKIPISLFIPLWKERVFEEWALTEGEAKILYYLRERGYVFASVVSEIKKEGTKLNIIYKVTPGKKYRPGEIIFYGVKHFPVSRLRNRFKLRTKPIEIWINGNRLFNLPKEIEDFYKSQGFLNVKITMNFQKVKNKLNVLIYINEGERSLIKKINFIGAKSFSRNHLLEQIKSFEGGPYYEPLVRADISRLEFFYLNNGFRGTDIKVRVKKKDISNISLDFIIKEGERIKIERIIIIGNFVTRRSVIKKELKIKEGDFAYRNKIIETKRRLEALGIFTEIKIEEIPLGGNKESLMIAVKEGKQNYIGFGLGLLTKREPYSSAVWNFEIMPRVTLEFSRNNIFGSASLFTFVTQIGPWEKRGVLSFEQPYFFSLPFKSFINAWIEEEDRKSFDYNKMGLSLTNIKRFNEDIILLYRMRWTRTTLFNLEISESEIDKEHRPFSTSSIAGTIIIDKRDDFFNPEKGFFTSFTSEWAHPLLGTESKYFKNFFQFQNYVPLGSRLNFSSTVRFGFAWGKVPISERFFAGGSNSFRGEKFDELGPNDPISLKPVGGKALILFNFELRFPITHTLKNLYGAIFYDTGNLFPELKQIKLRDIRNALGFGIRYKTPLGPIRIDFGIDLTRRKKIIPYITIGNVI